MSKTSSAFAPVRPRFVIAGITIMAIASWYSVNLPQPQSLNQPVKEIKTQVKKFKKSSATVSVPEVWRTEHPAKGVTSYTLPAEYKTALGYDAMNDRDTQESGQDLGIDGTRHPYISDISKADLTQDSHNPSHYSWNGVWQGEGYNRILDHNDRLVSEREKSVDIYLSISLDTSITDATKPNLIITIKNNQDKTAQLTNISAFQIDSRTGKTLDRQDFPQLPPVYEVTASRNGGYAGTETKELEPLGTATFAYHVSGEQLKQNLPIRLTAVNRLFAERQQAIYNLQARGWVVKEVPAPTY
jgi:hypothetical protein